MTDLLLLAVTLVAFAGLTLLVAALDRSDQRAAEQSER